MKNIFNILLLVPFLALAFACAKEDGAKIGVLEVNPNNISGNWSLKEMNNKPLPEGLFMDLEIIRRDKKFSYTENISGSETVQTKKTGRFDLTEDGVISLLYDSSMSQYGKSYKIVELEPDKMVWVCQDGSEEVFTFVRTEK